jgi:hypothetical protein
MELSQVEPQHSHETRDQISVERCPDWPGKEFPPEEAAPRAQGR